MNASGRSSSQSRDLSTRLSHIREALTQKPNARAIVLAVIVSIAAFIPLAFITPNGMLNGDAAAYTAQIAEGTLRATVVHIGYHALGIAFTRLVPIDEVLALNLMSALMSALGVGLVCSIAYTVTHRVSAALAAACAMLALPLFWANSVFAEVYASHLVFFLLTVQLLLWDRPVLMGVSLGCALLVTPATLLTIPFFIMLRPKWTFIVRWALPAGIIALAAWIPNYRDFLWGGIGMLNMPERDVTIHNALGKELRDVATPGAWILAVFVLAGVYALATSPKRRRIAYAIPILWVFPFLFGERYADVPLQLPLYAMLSVVAGVGLAWATHRWRDKRAVVLGIAVVFLGGVALGVQSQVPSTRQLSRQAESFRADVAEMASDARPGDVVIGKWPTYRLAQYYLVELTFLEWLDYEVLVGASARGNQSAEQKRLDAVTAAKQRVWLIDVPQFGDALTPYGYEVAPYKRYIFLASASSE